MEIVQIGRGRPLKYLTEAERTAAMKGYRKKWYDKNKREVKERYKTTADNIKEKRREHIMSGYFMLTDADDTYCYISFSKDIKARCSDILRNIRNEKQGSLYNRFNNDLAWKFRILEFANEKDELKIDGLYADYPHYNHLI
tara:strand:- start:1291 stop:1713 length:423 start_codon:yes stop_codon:yes gene_type:complete